MFINKVLATFIVSKIPYNYRRANLTLSLSSLKNKLSPFMKNHVKRLNKQPTNRLRYIS